MRSTFARCITVTLTLTVTTLGSSSWASGAELVPKITALPTGGDLYVVNYDSTTSVDEAHRIVAAGQLVTSAGRYVRYVPSLHGASSGPGVP